MSPLHGFAVNCPPLLPSVIGFGRLEISALPLLALLLSLLNHTCQGHHSKNLQLHGKTSHRHGFHDISVTDNKYESYLPVLTEPIHNVTVSVGRDVLLACVVDNLRTYKVAWVRVDTQTILSIHHNVITQNPRVSLSYTDHRTWYLHIKDVHESDRGWYMCQVNTDPMRSRQGYLQVVVPPSFVIKETSSDMVVREASNVTLSCKATGYPEPYVIWQREDGQNINYNGESVNVVNGEVLYITKISRLHMGAYLCIAANGVPPRISKRIHIKVQFPPMLSIPNQLEGAYVGQNISLACHTEAYPDSINYWTTQRGDMIISGYKYESIVTRDGYNQYMKLHIKNVELKDFGSYKCVAQNSLGTTDGVIKLYEIQAPLTTRPSNIRSRPTRWNGQGGRNAPSRPYDYDVEEWRNLGHGENSSGGDDRTSGALNLTLTLDSKVPVFLLVVLLWHMVFSAV